MSPLLAAFGAVALLLGGYCLVAIPAVGWRRWAAPPLLALLYAAVLIGGVQALGRPRPIGFDLPRRGEARMLAMAYAEGQAIWLWLAVPWAAEPVAYALPWSEEQAAALHQAQQAAEAEGTDVVIEGEFGPRGQAGELKPYPKPRPELPPKQEAP